MNAFVAWLVERCQDWQIRFDNERVLIRLAERANGSPGLALHVLARLTNPVNDVNAGYGRKSSVHL